MFEVCGIGGWEISALSKSVEGGSIPLGMVLRKEGLFFVVVGFAYRLGVVGGSGTS